MTEEQFNALVALIECHVNLATTQPHNKSDAKFDLENAENYCRELLTSRQV
jgi:hypothetical protein